MPIIVVDTQCLHAVSCLFVRFMVNCIMGGGGGGGGGGGKLLYHEAVQRMLMVCLVVCTVHECANKDTHRRPVLLYLDM